MQVFDEDRLSKDDLIGAATVEYGVLKQSGMPTLFAGLPQSREQGGSTTVIVIAGTGSRTG